MTALALLLFVLAAPVVLATSYLGLLAALAKQHNRAANELESDRIPQLRFDIVIPAHNEETTIAEVIQSLLSADYPKELLRIFVVADNCTDKTAEIAKNAGAIVLIRFDESLKGKGYALNFAFARILEDRKADAVAVIDADTVVSSNIFTEFSRCLSRGAGAVQAEYTVRNANASWRTRLMVIALASFHLLRSLARERLGLSVGLRGNGMALSAAILARVPYDAYSLVEDVEYGIKLGEAGCRVAFASNAKVFGEMVPKEDASRSQRRRWEMGRASLARARGPKLLALGIEKRSPLLIDLAIDVLLPPLATLSLLTLAGLTLALTIGISQGNALILSAPWVASAGFLSFYVLRGWQLSGTGLRGLLDLGWAPIYVLWKIGLMITGSKAKNRDWIRTTREKTSHDN